MAQNVTFAASYSTGSYSSSSGSETNSEDEDVTFYAGVQTAYDAEMEERDEIEDTMTNQEKVAHRRAKLRRATTKELQETKDTNEFFCMIAYILGLSGIIMLMIAYIGNENEYIEPPPPVPYNITAIIELLLPKPEF